MQLMMTVMKMTATKNGNQQRESGNGSLSSLFEAQQSFQHKVTGIQTPVDSTQWFTYHMNAMQEELGEVLKADKRWKTHRNAHYDPANKLEEIADVFVTAINIALYSGFDKETIYNAIIAKISENTEKYEKGCKNDSNS